MGRKVSTRNSSNSQRNIAVTVPAASTPATKRRNSSLRSQHHHLRASRTDHHPAMTGARVMTAVRTMIKGKAAAPAAGQRMGTAATQLLHVTVALHTAAATPMEAVVEALLMLLRRDHMGRPPTHQQKKQGRVRTAVEGTAVTVTTGVRISSIWFADVGRRFSPPSPSVARYFSQYYDYVQSNSNNRSAKCEHNSDDSQKLAS